MSYPADGQTLWNMLLKLRNMPTEFDGLTHVPVEVSLTDPETDAPLVIDADTGAMVTIDDIHHQVHMGRMFHYEFSASGVGNGASVDITFVTGAQNFIGQRVVRPAERFRFIFMRGSPAPGEAPWAGST